MKFFIDTAEIAEIREFSEIGLLDGVTTNPSLVAASGRDFSEVLAEICELVDGPVSAEVAAIDFETMLAEGRYLAGIAPNVTVKAPLTPAGIRACNVLSGEGISVNITLCFSSAQALLAARAGAAFVSPFVGRLDDIGENGMALVADIVDIFRQYPDINTQVLTASVRGPAHVVAAARAGSHVATLPPKVLRQMFRHPLTDIGLERLLADWKKTGQSILPH
jgi:transaldolase